MLRHRDLVDKQAIDAGHVCDHSGRKQVISSLEIEQRKPDQRTSRCDSEARPTQHFLNSTFRSFSSSELEFIGV